MKYFIVPICLVAIIVFSGSCKKDAGKIDSNADLIGSWELRQAQHGMIPTTDHPSGNGNIFKFSVSRYEKYTNGNLVKSGKYDLITDSSVETEVGLVILPGQFTSRIIFDGDLTAGKTFIEVSNNKMTFLSGYFPLDGGSYVLYEKTENNP
jgi:hypothetical protein